MNASLELKYLWHDIDVIELAVFASNGAFSGAAKPYVGVGGLAEAATSLEGFPQSLSDARELEFGAFGREFAGGCIHLRFFCKDGAGHAVVEVRIESEDERNIGSNPERLPQTVHFYAEVEAAAVDEFVSGLRQLEENLSGVAPLRFQDLNP